MHLDSVTVAEQATFGRHGAMFEGVLGFVAQLSLVLWGLVVLTTVIRFIGIHNYRHIATRTTLDEIAAPNAAVSPAGWSSDSALVRLGLIEPDAAERDTVLTPAELVEVHSAGPGTNDEFHGPLHSTDLPAAAAAYMVTSCRAPGSRRDESWSGAYAPQLAGNSTRA